MLYDAFVIVFPFHHRITSLLPHDIVLDCHHQINENELASCMLFSVHPMMVEPLGVPEMVFVPPPPIKTFIPFALLSVHPTMAVLLPLVILLSAHAMKFPTTCNGALGHVVPMPTFPPVVIFTKAI